MEDKTLNNWEDFEKELVSLEKTLGEKKEVTSLRLSNYLFRGHPDSSWRLETTLERYIVEPVRLKTYYRSIYAAKHEIETFTDKDWDIPLPTKFYDFIDKEDHLDLGSVWGYDYMMYMRHHGFPSPLLDWTRSPYVAAFFAFRNAVNTEMISIYAYQEYSTGAKSYSGESAYIQALGPYVKSHKRHFLQQSEYTVCFQKKEGVYYYASHEDCLQNIEEDQDLVWKFNIPASERIKVLKALDSYNLNVFSLFGNEESLMETIAFREMAF